jgi:beta-galactosidase
MKSLLLQFCMISCLYVGAFAQSRQTLNFDNGWKFQLGHAADAVKDFNYSIGNIFSKTGKGDNTAIAPLFNDSSWRQLDLPHDWAVELPFENSSNFDVMAHGYKPVGGLFPQNSIGWYRKKFDVNAKDSGQRFVLQFDGVFRNSSYWINGIYLGNNLSGYLGASFDITDFVNYQKPNVLVVRVDATQYEGWFYEGAGIYRHVWLHQYNNTHVVENSIFIHSKVSNNKALVDVSLAVTNKSLNTVGATVQTIITHRNGERIASSSEQSMKLSVNQEKQVQFNITLQNPKLWSLENPYLYRAITLIRQGGKVIDIVTARFGIRTIAMNTTDGLLLNGKSVKINGVNCHQDHAGVGSALPDYLQYYRIRLLKEMGVNGYRTSHNAPTPELLDACDSLGILVMDETRLLNSGTEYLSQLERLIKRDRNHPSVFMWSIGNEEGLIHSNSIGKRIAQTMMAKQLELDPTRLCTYAADNGKTYYGANEVVPIRSFNYRIKDIETYHKQYPTQPIIGTEMGSTVTTRGIYVRDSIRAYVPDQDISAPWWANTAEEWWKLAADKKYWLGSFIWTGFDYRGEPTPFAWPNVNSHFGILDMCGFPKNIYYYYQSWWTTKDVLHISPHWNTPRGLNGEARKVGDVVDVWVNSNADEVELFLNQQSLGKKKMPLNSHIKWQLNYQPGILKAIAYKQGRQFSTTVETTGEATEIILTPDRTIIIADGKDATVINVTVNDSKGRAVPDANQMIAFELIGDAKIIGVGNGDPSSHEADKFLDGNYKRSLFSGKCQVIVQSSNKPSTFQLKATSNGLKAATVNIVAQ